MFARQASGIGALTDPRRYEQQIERLHARHLLSPELYELQQAEVSLASVVLHKREIARLLARTVARGDYRFEPARLRRILVEDKERVVYALRLTDLIVHGVVNSVIEEALTATLLPNVYSYRKGCSWWTAVADFARYVRAHYRERPDPRTRGLCVLRRDIDAYTDTIPVGARSRLWPMLRAVLADGGDPAALEERWDLITSVVRPEAIEEAGRVFTNLRGVPTGQPIACTLFNLYLGPLDRELSAVRGAFYARYSDDILFAHPDPDVVRAADATLDRAVAELDLAVNPSKRRDLYLTAAGRRSEAWPEARPVMAVPFLGSRVSAHATISLSRQKVRRLLDDVRRRAAQTVRAAPDDRTDRVGRLVCAVVNRVLTGRVDPFHQRSADLLRRAVTDRAQLRQLDYRIARIVVGAVTGDWGARSFRQVPYRKIRSDWRLTSLLYTRNRWARAARR